MKQGSKENENETMTTIEIEDLERKQESSLGGDTVTAATEDKAQEYLNLLQRVKADFDNYRKRVQYEQSGIFDQVRAEFSKQFLPILDDFERLLEVPAEDGQIREGARIIYKNFKDILTTAGLKSFAAAGDTFDPTIHEAMAVEHTTSELEGKVIQIWQKGYRFKGKLLRPAKVKVGVKMEEQPNQIAQRAANNKSQIQNGK